MEKKWMNRDEKILIVGGAGYIGGYMTDFLLSRNYDVTIYDNLMYEPRFLKDVPFIFGDIRNKKKLSKILPNFNIVIWLASIVGDGACALDPYLTQTINEDIVKWFVDHYDGKIIYTSTCSVYGINHELIDESAAVNPLSIYAKTKLGAEQYIVHHAKDYLIFRLGTLYGVGDEHSRIRLDLVANVLTKHAMLNKKMVVYGGDQWRPLLHVRDVSTAVEYGIKYNIQGLYNLSSKNYTISEIAMTIKNKLSDNVQIEYVDTPFEDLRNYRVSSKVYVNQGWHPSFRLEEGIRDICSIIEEMRIRDLDDPIYSCVHYLTHHTQMLENLKGQYDEI
jgi:nucleoside-diphosphate-sugar epimerase